MIALVMMLSPQEVFSFLLYEEELYKQFRVQKQKLITKTFNCGRKSPFCIYQFTVPCSYKALTGTPGSPLSTRTLSASSHSSSSSKGSPDEPFPVPLLREYAAKLISLKSFESNVSKALSKKENEIRRRNWKLALTYNTYKKDCD
uniref:Uncharacterized protein n=1 Tax=Glossina morsitans morsitans TaxID=37546 RepID=A0A1B0G370_GLOMM